MIFALIGDISICIPAVIIIRFIAGMAVLIAKLASDHLPECYVEDPSKEVFWNMWQESSDVRKVMLLNTDWTNRGNRKKVKVHTPVCDLDTEIIEREAKILTVLKNAVIETDEQLHVEVVNTGMLRIHGRNQGVVKVHKSAGDYREFTVEFDKTPFAELKI